jgi:hypothetical protein
MCCVLWMLSGCHSPIIRVRTICAWQKYNKKYLVAFDQWKERKFFVEFEVTWLLVVSKVCPRRRLCRSFFRIKLLNSWTKLR